MLLIHLLLACKVIIIILVILVCIGFLIVVHLIVVVLVVILIIIIGSFIRIGALILCYLPRLVEFIEVKSAKQILQISLALFL